MKNPFQGAATQARRAARAAAQVVTVVPLRVSSEDSSPEQGKSSGPFREVASEPSRSPVVEQGSERSAGAMASARSEARCLCCQEPLHLPEGVIVFRVCKRCVDGGFRVAGMVARLGGWLEKITK